MNFYELSLAKRYLTSRKNHAFLSVITFISVAGVAVGVMALIVVLSVMSGFQDDFRQKILGNNAPLILFSVDGETQNDRELMKKIASVEGVTGVSPFAYHELLMTSGGGRATGMVLYGIEPKEAAKVTSLEKDMVEGSLSNLEQPMTDEDPVPGVIVGYELAKTLFLHEGSEVNVVSPSGELTPFGFGPRMRKLKVVGVFKSGLFEYDSKSAYANLDSTQRLLGKPGLINGVQINVAHLDKVIPYAKNIQNKVGSNFYLRHWMELNEDLFAAFKLEKTVFFIVVVMIVLVASFNIIGMLTLLVMTKRKEISILKAMGATHRSVMSIFVYAGSIIGFIGTGLGLVLGIGLALTLKYYFPFPLNSSVYQVDHLPVKLALAELVTVAISSVVISFLSTIVPARQAAAVEPSQGIRYE